MNAVVDLLNAETQNAMQSSVREEKSEDWTYLYRSFRLGGLEVFESGAKGGKHALEKNGLEHHAPLRG